ncbi:MAG: helix-turn-helix domain-containing protein [Bacteroidales bacterium]|nr:helix-turn-helix domain-containing protein [Bacteroidales bacterium]
MNQRTDEAIAASAVQFDKRTYTVDEIQDILGISRSGAYNLVKKNLFHSVRIGGTIRISKKSFDAWLEPFI